MSRYKKTMAEALKEVHEIGTDEYRKYLEKLTPGQDKSIDEKLGSSQIAKLKKAYEPMRGKKISSANAEKLMKIMDMVDKDKNTLIQLFKANIPFVSDLASARLISKHNMKGAQLNKLKEELDEMSYKPGKMKDTRPQEKGAKEFDKLIKTGGMDKKDFQKARQLYVQASDAASREKLKKFIYNLDTEPTEAIMDLIGRNDPDTFNKMYPKSKPGEYLSSISFNHRNVKAEARKIDPADIDTDATDDDIKAADKNIIMQMRKVVSLRGNFKVEFGDKKKMKIDPKIAMAVQDKYNSLRRADEKEKFQAKVSKSYKDMLSAIKEGFASDAQRRAAFASGYKAKGKKGKKEEVKEEAKLDEKVKEYQGVAYFKTRKDAEAHMKKFAPKGRVVEYERGYAVQTRISGPYLNKAGKTEEVELDEMKMNDPKLNKIFNKLKPKATVQVKTSSSIAKGKDFKTYLVVSKNTLRNGTEKITLKNRENPTGVKSFLYRSDDGKITFAIGDMGASIDDIKEQTTTILDRIDNKLKERRNG